MSTSPVSRVARVFPIARWLPSYQAGWIAPEVIAGVTVWALVVPEAMAYATRAADEPTTPAPGVVGRRADHRLTAGSPHGHP
jgi:SulP family sulfate permease